MAVRIYNSSWKDDLYLMEQLKEQNSKGCIFKYMKRDFSQAGITCILKSSPTCQSSYLFTRISALPNISMSMNSERCFLCKSN